MGFYDGTTKRLRIFSAGFGICALAFLIRLLSVDLDWRWLGYVSVAVMVIGLAVASWGVFLSKR